MSVITVVMLAAFGTIYFTTWKQVHLGIDAELARTAFIHTDSFDSRIPPEGEGDVNPPPERFPTEQDWGERGISFSLVVDTSSSITSVRSFYEEESSFYEEALQSALEDGEEKGVVSFADSRWAFMSVDMNGQRVYGFVDIDERLSILTRLMYTFLAVAAGTLFLIFLVSYYLTQRSLKPAEEAFIRQKEFISHASHELKTPLAVIGANTELLLGAEESEKPTEEQHKRLRFMNDEVVRMSTLIKNLLFLASFDEGRKSSVGSISRVNISDTVESHLLGMEGFIYEKGFTLDYTVDPDLFVDGSSQQIQQVLSALIDNALKYGTSGSGISISLKAQGGKAQLSVANRGEGIAFEEQERIFDRFYRGDKARTRTHASYGLGLSIVRTIVQQHHGTISVSSGEGENALTTFTVRLPLSRSPQQV